MVPNHPPNLVAKGSALQRRMCSCRLPSQMRYKVKHILRISLLAETFNETSGQALSAMNPASVFCQQFSEKLHAIAEELQKKISVRLHHPVCKGFPWEPCWVCSFHCFSAFFFAREPRSFAGTSKCHETNSKDRFHGISVNLRTRKP